MRGVTERKKDRQSLGLFTIRKLNLYIRGLVIPLLSYLRGNRECLVRAELVGLDFMGLVWHITISGVNTETE